MSYIKDLEYKALSLLLTSQFLRNVSMHYINQLALRYVLVLSPSVELRVRLAENWKMAR
jgi:hypothetical protein